MIIGGRPYQVLCELFLNFYLLHTELEKTFKMHRKLQDEDTLKNVNDPNALIIFTNQQLFSSLYFSLIRLL